MPGVVLGGVVDLAEAVFGRVDAGSSILRSVSRNIPKQYRGIAHCDEVSQDAERNEVVDSRSLRNWPLESKRVPNVLKPSSA